MINLGNGHKFSGMDEVQNELTEKIIDLAPDGCSNMKQIPIMSAGDDIG